MAAKQKTSVRNRAAQDTTLINLRKTRRDIAALRARVKTLERESDLHETALVLGKSAGFAHLVQRILRLERAAVSRLTREEREALRVEIGRRSRG